MPIATVFRLRSTENGRMWKWQPLSRFSLYASASPWASLRGECLCDKRRQLLLQKELSRSPGMCQDLTRQAPPVWRHRKSINDGFFRHDIAAAESRSREIVDILSRANRRRLRPLDTAKYCFEEYPRTCMHPYCFSLHWRGIRLFYYTIFVANLEKFCLFFSSGEFLHPFFAQSLLSDFATSIPFRISSSYPDSSEVRRFCSYDFYPVNNIDFNMMSFRLWTRNLSGGVYSRIWLSYLNMTGFISYCIRLSIVYFQFYIYEESKNLN